MSQQENNPPEIQQVPQVKPDLKKMNSYTYWVDANNKRRELPEQQKPKKIDPPPPSPISAAVGPSTWNSSGTWQQRTISNKQLNTKITNIVSAWLGENKNTLVLTSVQLQGELKQIFANGKRKVMYEISGVLKFQGDGLEIKLEEVTCSGDKEYKVKGKKAQEKTQLSKIASRIIDMMVEQFNRYKE